MTTQSRLQVHYVSSTETEAPKILVSLKFPWLLLLKILILGEYAHVWHILSEAEINTLSETISHWRIVNKLRANKRKH